MFEAFYAGKGEMESVYVEVYKYGKLIGCVLADEELLFSPFNSAVASYPMWTDHVGAARK